MKKWIIILVVISIGAMLFKGDIPSRMILFNLAVPTGTDTTYYFEFWHQEPWGMEVLYKSFDANDAELSFGACSFPNGSSFNNIDTATFPAILADSTFIYESDSYNFKYLAFQLTSNSVTAGIAYQLIFHTDMKVNKVP